MVNAIVNVVEGAARIRFALLVVAMLVLIAGAPTLGNDPDVEADVAIVFSLVVLGLSTATDRIGIAVTMAVLWLWLTWVTPFGTGALGEIASDAALIVLIAIAVESALARALRAQTVDREAICAALATYLLLGVGWAALYTMIETAAPGSFALPAENVDRPWSALLYFSFATLTTLGYGDVLPLTPPARGGAILQAIAGTFFMAVLVARLVSIYGTRDNDFA